MKNKEKIMEKVNKLFRLSESSNPHEASLALERAKGLLDKYDLKYYEIDNTTNILEKDVLKSGRIETWKKMLHTYLAKLFDCEIYYNCKVKCVNNRRKTYRILQVVGHDIDIQLYKSGLEFIEKQLESMVKTEIDVLKNTGYLGNRKATTSFKHSFMYSALNEINDRIDIIKAEKKHKKGRGYDIVISKKENIKNFMKDMNINRENTNFSITDYVGAERGKEAGKRVNLNNPIENNS